MTDSHRSPTELRTWLWQELDAFERGMGPHYATLYSIVRGCEAKRVFEFGTGPSSQAIIAALRETGGLLHSVSPDARAEIPTTLNMEYWQHTVLRSAAVYPYFESWGPFDVVLHDGSHDVETVTADLVAVIPHVRQYGIILVHDSQHEYSGEGVRRGIIEALRRARTGPGADIYGERLFTLTTLPYAFGLTIIRVERQPGNCPQPPLVLKRAKRGGKYTTVLAPVIVP